jgi:two-component system, NtrC family, sensor histidine kinase HydH
MLAALVLVGATGWNHWGVTRQAHGVAAGQADLLARALAAELMGGPPTAALLMAAHEELEDEGVRWVGIVDDSGGVAAEGGTRPEPLRLPPPLAGAQAVGDVWIAAVPLPPRPDGALPMPAAGAGGPPRDVALAAAGAPPGHLAFSYVPLAAHELRDRSARTLAVAALAALLLVGAALLSFRAWVQADAAERALAEGRHLASLGQVSAVLAHEIRNPLAALKGHAQLLAEVLEGQDRLERRAIRVVDEAVRLEKLTNELLDFARGTALKRRPTDVPSLVRALAQDTDPERVQLDLDDAPQSWALDRDKLHQVLLNLLRNALTADAAGGAVAVRVAREGRVLHIDVRDDGPGLPPGDPEKLFEPFFTTKTRGTGLGLSVSRRIVRLHGGTLTARTHPDGGAEFALRIPEESHGALAGRG